MKIFKSFILCSIILLAAHWLVSAENHPVNVTALRKIITGKKSTSSAIADAMQQLKAAADRHHTEAEYWYAWMRFYGKGNQSADRSEALKYFTLAAEKNHPLALFWVGYFYGNGYVVKKDPVKAREYMQRSANTGNLPQMLRFAQECVWHNYFPTDHKTAVEYLEKCRTRKYPPAVYELARCYARGIGVKRDRTKAFELYCQAADLGHTESAYQAAMASFFNRGTRRDMALEFKYLSQAAGKGHREALYRLGNAHYFGFGTPQDFQLALNYFHKAAQKGSLAAIVQIGYCYYRGFGVKKDLAEAVKWYEKAAKKHDIDAYMQLARLYFTGEGVKQDHQKSFEYYMLIEKSKKHIEKRIVASEIALFYEQGIVVKKDLSKAFYYNDRAYTNLGRIKAGVALLNGIGVEKNPAKALEKFNKTVEIGKSPLGAFMAAMLYISQKDGVEYDPAKAEKLLLLSAKAGYKPAMKALVNLYMTGQKGFAKKPLEAEKWHRNFLQTKNMPEDFFISEPHL